MAIKIDIIADDKANVNIKKTTGEFNKLKTSIDKTGKSAETNTSKMGSAFNKIGSIAKVAIGVGIVAAFTTALVAAKKFFDFMKREAIKSLGEFAKFQQTKIAFETMLGSIEAANKLIKELESFAIRTPFETTEVIEGAKRLMAYGVVAKDIIPTFETLGDIASGVGRDKLPQLITAFGQVGAKGKLMGQELLQFTEAGVNLGAALQKAFGVTRTELEKMISTGKVGFEDVRKALDDIAKSDFSGLMEKQSKTIGGLVSTIKGHFQLIRREIGSALSEAGVGKALEKIADKMNEFAEIGWGNVIKAMGEMWLDLMQFMGATIGMVLPDIIVGMAGIPGGIIVESIKNLRHVIAGEEGSFKKAMGDVSKEMAEYFVVGFQEKLPEFENMMNDLLGNIKTRALEIKNTLGEELGGKDNEPLKDAGEDAGKVYGDAFVDAVKHRAVEFDVKDIVKRPELPVGPYDIPKEEMELPTDELSDSAKAFEDAFMASAQIVANELNSMWDQVFGKAESVFEKMAKVFVTTFINAIVQAEARYLASALLKLLTPGGSILGAIFGFHGGGYVDWAGGSRGGYGAIPKRHSGGYESDETLARIKRHEFIVQDKSVNPSTRSGLEHINRTGRMPVNASINVSGDNININGSIDPSKQIEIQRAVKEKRIELAKTIQDLLDDRMVTP